MGAGIAQVCAGAGMLVSLVDVSVERAATGKAGIDRQLKRLAEKGKTTLDMRRYPWVCVAQVTRRRSKLSGWPSGQAIP